MLQIIIFLTGAKRRDDDWIQVHADQEYVLRVDMDRINKIKVCSFLDNLCFIVKILLIFFFFFLRKKKIFLEQPSTGTLKVKRLKNQII